jgi:hypothetical protein
MKDAVHALHGRRDARALGDVAVRERDPGLLES